jgi:hypothetical protein
MNISIHHSTPNRGLSATSQAPRELGDSQKFLEKCDASRLSQTSPVQGRENCPHCGSGNLKIGAGLQPGEESRRCNDCKHFLGYSPLRKLKKARKRQELTNCLEILENQGIRGDVAVFVLGQVGGEV